MLRKMIAAACLALLGWLPVYPVHAQQAQIVTSCGTQSMGVAIPGTSGLYINAQGQLCVNATVNATVGGFQPNGSYGTLTATAASSASTALPTGATVRITNLGASAIVSCTFATGAATGLVSNLTIPPLSSVSRVVGSFDHIACIDQTGSTGSNLIVLEGGSGLGNDSGGGGGSGGGASNITQVGGTNVNAAVAAAGALPIDVIPGNNLATLIAASVPAGTARIGYVSDDPCSNASIKAFLPITLTTAAVKVIAPGVAAKKITICHIDLNNSAADSIAVFESTTGTTCATAAVAVYGAGTSVATAGNGYNFSANGGISLGNGKGTVGQTTVNNNDLCIAQSAATPLTGGITYAVQ